MLISDLRIFLAVTSTGSLSAAARQLDVGPMQVSRRIAALEEELGVRLFHRTTRSVSLTVEGEALLPYASTMSEAEENARGELSQTSSRVSGVLRMSAPSVLGQSIVLALLPRLLAQHPELRIDLSVSDRIVDIVAQGLDLALRIAPLADSELVAWKIAVNPRVIFAAPGYLSRHGRPSVVADLDTHDCIVLEAIPRWPLVIDKKLQRKSVRGRLQTTSVEAVRTAAIQGLGLAMLTYVDVIQQLQDGSLVEVQLQDASMEELAVWAVMPSRRYIPARVRVFLEALEAELAQQRI
ncbi:LysR family transcriptional regulator [Pseudomonas brassicacearum]|uniref:LysR family transcriptional regulator n=1 Tax=Pseudomonas brassicacearum TaxID=930166 RepID=A0A423HBB4_9PSED|nr:LysR family transcriptional regulator [Pseudomonas brassicacearum]RON10419.1 LysR family transcriptional regulator [Pseudomonas brassicacearum]